MYFKLPYLIYFRIFANKCQYLSWKFTHKKKGGVCFVSLVKKIQDLCRNKNNISVSKLEKELGFGNGSICRWDVNSPSVNKVLKVAQYFGVSVDFLLSEIKEGA